MNRTPLTPEQDKECSRRTAELVRKAQLKDSLRQTDLLKIKDYVTKLIQEDK